MSEGGLACRAAGFTEWVSVGFMDKGAGAVTTSALTDWYENTVSYEYVLME